VAKGDLLGWFNMGSTVIVLTSPGTTRWDESMTPGRTMIMGRRMGTTVPAA
jgi:phosphatidylserine decarboxylase